MTNKGYYLFTQHGEYYLYDFMGGIILQTHKPLYDTLVKYQQGFPCEDSERQIVSRFMSCGLLANIDSQLDADPTENTIAYLSFAPTYECNFRCTYCFGEHGDKYTGNQRAFTEETLVQTLDYFFKKAFPLASHYRIDFVSGGEPLLGMPIIKCTVDYIESFSQLSGKPVSLWLCTNGSLLTEEIIEYLSLHNISIGISIDGKKEWNDAHRIDVLGNGTYDAVCNSITLIKQSNKVSRKFKKIWGLCAATNENCNFVEILDHMNSLGFQNVQIRLVRSSQSYDIDKIASEYDRLADTLLEMFSKGDLSFFRMILNNNDQFGKVLKRVLLNQLLIRRCNAGVNKLTICPDGTIYPCDSLVGMQNFCVGCIDDGMYDNSIYKQITVDSIDKCNSCDIKYLCGGDCYYNAFMKTGHPLNPDDEFCQIQRHIIELAIILRYKMEINDTELYKKIVMEVKRKDDYSEMFG